ncbi:MAG: hypothetical protein ACK5TK_05500 [Betaproteobacteria bacterium]
MRQIRLDQAKLHQTAQRTVETPIVDRPQLCANVLQCAAAIDEDQDQPLRPRQFSLALL